MPEPVIEIERIEIVPGIQGRQFCVMAQRVMTYQGQTRYIEPVNLLVGNIDANGLPQEVQDAIASINSSLQTQVDTLTADIAAANAAKQQAESDKAAALEQLAAANARIAELEAQINPPNPFPNADWASFKFTILSDPAIQRVAAENATAWPLMVLYLSQLDTNPARGADIAQLWNFIEAHSAVNSTEIARINAISQQFGIPLQMNSEGQIVLP